MTILLIVSGHLALAGTGDVLRTVAELNAAISNGIAGLRYDVTAKIVRPFKLQLLTFYAADSTGTAMFGLDSKILNESPTNVGDIVRISGIVVETSYKGKVGLHSEQITLVSHGDPPEPIPASAKDIYRNDGPKNSLVSIKGVVYDTFRDEIDHPWSFLVLNCDGTPVYVALFAENVSPDELEQLIGANVSVSGIVESKHYGNRATLERYISAHDISSVKVLSPAADPFTVPEYSSPPFTQTRSAMVLGRKRTSGHVIAVWDGGRRVLVKTGDGSLVRADLKPHTPPRYGKRIEICGIPATDLYRRNLASAIWRYAPDVQFQDEEPISVQVKDLFTDSKGNVSKNANLYGHAVTISGIVRALPPDGAGAGRLYMEKDSFMVPVDVSACPTALDGITVGCTLEISGTYILETDNLRSNNIFPQINECLVVVRKPGDISLIASPPWWTPARLVMLIAALALVTLGIFWWNIALRRRAEMRGKELADEQVAHMSSEMKALERTRLAVELHDSLSQTLAGVSMGISTALDAVGDANAELKHPLELTSKMVEACRTELRNCLWDLRSKSLEQESMDDAIRIALAQIVATANIAVRFNVPRATLSDKTAHAILCIVRELATNALRHGKATSIRIAGSIEDRRLKFSVYDNGCGFAPQSAPGIDKGHFGLQGIRERLELMDGEMRIDSRPGLGTKVTVTLTTPSEKVLGECLQ